MDIAKFAGFLIFLSIFTMGFWLMLFLATFIVPLWLFGNIKEAIKYRKEGKKKSE
ncbi:MAG: hypothetical protein ACWA42_10165 [Lutibacter sp.]